MVRAYGSKLLCMVQTETILPLMYSKRWQFATTHHTVLSVWRHWYTYVWMRLHAFEGSRHLFTVYATLFKQERTTDARVGDRKRIYLFYQMKRTQCNWLEPASIISESIYVLLLWKLGLTEQAIWRRETKAEPGTTSSHCCGTEGEM